MEYLGCLVPQYVGKTFRYNFLIKTMINRVHLEWKNKSSTLFTYSFNKKVTIGCSILNVERQTHPHGIIRFSMGRLSEKAKNE